MRVQDLRLGWRSHLLACGFGAQIVERDDHLVVRSPGNPTYYWGNFLLLREAPRDDTVSQWRATFEREIASRQPESRHVAIGADVEDLPHPLPSWRVAGIDEIDAMAVLTMRAPALRDAVPPAMAGVQLRALRWPDDLDAVVAAQVRARDASFDEAGYRVFRRQAMQRIAAMHAAGLAQWFGAWVDGQLAADCGLVHDGRLGRFQYVETQAEWRRRGLCRALVNFVCRHAFDRLGLEELVMCADPHDVAIGIYRSVGFAQIERHWCLQKRPPRPGASS